MGNTKRFLCFFLTVIFCLSLLPAAVAAEEEAPAPAETEEEVITEEPAEEPIEEPAEEFDQEPAADAAEDPVEELEEPVVVPPDAPVSPCLVVSSAEGETSSEVTVTISGVGNPGIAYLGFTFQYDHTELELIRVAAGTLTGLSFGEDDIVWENSGLYRRFYRGCARL